MSEEKDIGDFQGLKDSPLGSMLAAVIAAGQAEKKAEAEQSVDSLIDSLLENVPAEKIPALLENIKAANEALTGIREQVKVLRATLGTSPLNPEQVQDVGYTGLEVVMDLLRALGYDTSRFKKLAGKPSYYGRAFNQNRRKKKKKRSR